MKFPSFHVLLPLLIWGPEGSCSFLPTSLTVSRSHRLSSTELFNLEKLAKKEVSDKEVEELMRNYGEKARVYRRDVFTSSDWIRYRRPDRFVDHLLNVYSSGLLRQLSFEISVVALLSTFVVLYNDLFVEGFVDLSGHKYGPLLHLPALQLPMLPFTISTASLGLLLTFRTNVSYGRWNEARTAWGKVINDSRSIVRMGCIWARSYNNIDDAALQRLGEAVCSFSRTLMNRTLPPQEDSERFKQYTFLQITDQRYGQVLRNAKHRPTAALAEITQILVDFELNPIHQVEVERVVTGLCDALGASERIFTSPVPTFYTRHTARFLAVWLFALPLGLYAPFASTWNHVVMIPVTIVIGLFLLGIEELATQMEEPFSILPMEKMCEASIRTPVMEQVERSMYGSWKPNTSIPVVIKPAETIYPAPDKVTIIEQPPPPPEEPDLEYEDEPPILPTISEPVQISRSSSNFSKDLSEADKARLRMYLDPPPPTETRINGGTGGIMTVEEMNRLWARQSGSMDS